MRDNLFSRRPFCLLDSSFWGRLLHFWRRRCSFRHFCIYKRRHLNYTIKKIIILTLTLCSWLTTLACRIDRAFPGHFGQHPCFLLINHRTHFVVILVITSSLRSISPAGRSRRFLRLHRGRFLGPGSGRGHPLCVLSCRLHRHFTDFGLIWRLCRGAHLLGGSQRRGRFAFWGFPLFQLALLLVKWYIYCDVIER